MLASPRVGTHARLGAGCVAALLLVGAIPAAVAQTGEAGTPVAPGTWQAFPAMRQVQAIASSDGTLWAGTDGGVFRYDPASGEIRRYTTVDGLSSPAVRSLAIDERHAAVWIGHASGTLDRLDPRTGAIRTFFEIARADRYAQRGINRIRPTGDSLLVATDFGVVVFDVVRGEVRDTFERFGALETGIPVFDILAAPLSDGAPGFWVATRDGVASARQDAPNLRAASAWTVDAASPRPALVLAYFDGAIFAGKGRSPGSADPDGDLRRRVAQGHWARQYVTLDPVFDLISAGDRLTAISPFFVGVLAPGAPPTTHQVLDATMLISAGRGPDGRVWVGDRVRGVLQLPVPGPVSGPVEAVQTVVPSGPLTNDVRSIDVGADGAVWVGYRPSLGLIDGMGRLSGASWTNFSTLTGHRVASGTIRSVVADRRGMAWGSAEGGGLMRVEPDGTVTVFGEDNSTLRAEAGFPGFIISHGVTEGPDGRIWVTNYGAVNPLHVWDPDGGWTAVPRPAATPAIANRFSTITVDRFGQKWVSLIHTTSPAGAGFMAIRTGATDPTQTDAVAVTGAGSAATGTGLPHPSVRAMVEDLDGRMWIGTERGLALVFSPGSAVANPALAQPTWARTADQAAYLLRDLHIFAMTVDASGRLWLASSSGLWVVNAAGNEVEAHFTPENSPLASTAVIDLVYDATTGTIWLATEAGVMSYRTTSTAPARRAERLRVYPNPYRPAQDPFVRIEGLVARTRIRILTPDGQVVAAMEARGGSATWDGRDQRTGQLVPSGVYLVSAAGMDGEGTAHGKIAVIR